MGKNGSLLKTLASLRFTVAILFVLVVICLIGTIFPQEGGPFAHEHARITWLPALLSPYDIFHSAWFMAAGALLCLNLALCMRGRLNLRRRNPILLLLHGGILLVAAGYAMGFLSLEAFMEIPEGASVSEAMLRKGGVYDLGFTVRCDRFTIDYYQNGMPREYVSDITFLKKGAVAGQARLMVNHPARFEGLNFYQESFRDDALSASMTVSDGKASKKFKVAQGDVIDLSPDGTQALVVKIWGDLMHLGPAVKLQIRGPSGEMNLWVIRDLAALKEKMPEILEQMPGFNPSIYRPYTFSLESLDVSYATGIGVKRDPGATVAAAGGALFLVCLMLLLVVPGTGAGGRQASVRAARRESAGEVLAEGREERP
jgi:cytochrome c biogenesis protein ResB